jgi:hypothetical protein
MLYIWDEPWHTEVSPVIVPGWEGSAVTDTLSVRGVLVPQELVAVTEIVPPSAPAVAEIVVETELPLHPNGNVHA